jgi:transposase
LGRKRINQQRLPVSHRQSAGEVTPGLALPAISARRQNARTLAFHPENLRDAGYQGPRVATAARRWIVESVKRTELHHFAVVQKHWIVESTPAWIGHNRSLMRAFERDAQSVAAFTCLTMIKIMLGRLTPPKPCS